MLADSGATNDTVIARSSRAMTPRSAATTIIPPPAARALGATERTIKAHRHRGDAENAGSDLGGDCRSCRADRRYVGCRPDGLAAYATGNITRKMAPCGIALETDNVPA